MHETFAGSRVLWVVKQARTHIWYVSIPQLFHAKVLLVVLYCCIQVCKVIKLRVFVSIKVKQLKYAGFSASALPPTL